jgi:hypothetical protein
MTEPQRCRHCKLRVHATVLRQNRDGDVAYHTFPLTCPWCRADGLYLETIDGVDRVKYLAAPRLTDDENFPVLTGLDKGFLQSLRIESW